MAKAHQNLLLNINYWKSHHFVLLTSSRQNDIMEFMRTTLALDDEARRLVQAYARRAHVSLGKAASELIRRGGHYRLETTKVNGLPVFQVPEGFPKITAEQVEELLDQE